MQGWPELLSLQRHSFLRISTMRNIYDSDEESNSVAVVTPELLQTLAKLCQRPCGMDTLFIDLPLNDSHIQQILAAPSRLRKLAMTQTENLTALSAEYLIGNEHLRYVHLSDAPFGMGDLCIFRFPIARSISFLPETSFVAV